MGLESTANKLHCFICIRCTASFARFSNTSSILHETTTSWIHLGQLQGRFERALHIRMSMKDPRQLWFLTCTASRRPPTSSESELTRKERSRSVPTDPLGQETYTKKISHDPARARTLLAKGAADRISTRGRGSLRNTLSKPLAFLNSQNWPGDRL